MPAPRPAEIVERARHLVTTTVQPLSEIAAEVDVCAQTLGSWIKTHGWTRPPGADERRKIPRRKYAALQRIYENRFRVADIAVVADCSSARLYGIAADEGWTPRRASAEAARRSPDKTLSAAVAEIQDDLRDPALTRKDFIRLSERAIALAAADALGGDTAGKVAAIASLTRSAQHMHDLWERETRSEADGGDDEPASADELRDELARRLERLRGAEQDRGGS